MREKGKGFIPDFYIPTFSHQLNNYLENGGLPSGSVSQIQGSGEGSFKTTAALELMSKAQNGQVVWRDGVTPYPIECAYVDAEGALDLQEEPDGTVSSEWLSNLGVDPNNMYIQGPDTGENIFGAIKDLIVNYNVKFIILDSIHATQPSIIHDSEAGDAQVMAHAKLHTIELVKLIPLVRKYQVHLVAINHLKVNMTRMGAMGEKAGGGKAWRFYSRHIMINNRSTSKSKLEGNDIIDVNIYLEKNKTGSSFKQFDLFARQGYGFDKDAELLNIALDSKVLYKKGAWIKVKETDETVGQGLSDSVINWCRDNKDVILSQFN